ncbi:TldD/PmbA family protein, partial [bacterium]|nr:TldD/PmbA family protein [bacterium]
KSCDYFIPVNRMKFMIFEKQIEGRVLSLIKKYKKQTDYLEIRLEEKDNEGIALNKDGIQKIGSSTRVGGCVRSCFKGGFGFTSFCSLDQVEDKVKEAIAISKLIGNSKTNLAPVPVIKDWVKLKPILNPKDISLTEKVNLLRSYQEVFERVKSDRIMDYSIKFSQDFHNKLFVNSEGSHIKQEFLAMDFVLGAIAYYNGVQTPMQKVFNSTMDFKFCRNKESEIKDICDDAHLFSDAKDMKGCETTVIMDAALSGVFAHEAFGHTSEADLFASSPGGRETLKIGRKFGKDILNIYDCGDMWNHSGSLKYDDEGVATRKSPLIEKGVLVGRLHTRSTAYDFGEDVTGSARAMTYEFPPIVRMRNTCIGVGKDKFEDLVADVKDGIYAVSLRGGFGGEDFSFSPLKGYIIKNGKICEPVKNFNITGNLFETLGNIDGITGPEDFETLAASGENGGCGKMEQYPLPVGMTAPRIRISKITVGGN